MILAYWRRKRAERRWARYDYEADTKILSALPADAAYRLPLRRISDTTGLTDAIVLYRLGEMIEKGWVKPDDLIRIWAGGGREQIAAYYLTPTGRSEAQARYEQ